MKQGTALALVAALVLAPACADALRDLIVDGSTTRDLSPFRPSRYR